MRTKKGRPGIKVYRAAGRMFGQTFATIGAEARSCEADRHLSESIEGGNAYDDGIGSLANPYAVGSDEGKWWARGWLLSWRLDGFPDHRDDQLDKVTT